MPTKSSAKKSTPVSFATKIKPLFTTTDVAHMKPRNTHLHDYSWMKIPANAAAVKYQVDHDLMPPGAPWSQAKKDLFQKWIHDGYKP